MRALWSLAYDWRCDWADFDGRQLLRQIEEFNKIWGQVDELSEQQLLDKLLEWAKRWEICMDEEKKDRWTDWKPTPQKYLEMIRGADTL